MEEAPVSQVWVLECFGGILGVFREKKDAEDKLEELHEEGWNRPVQCSQYDLR